MRSKDLKIGERVTVRPTARGVARFDGVVKSVVGNFVSVDRGGELGGDEWVVGAHEIQTYDGLTDFQRKILGIVRAKKSERLSDMTFRLDTFKNATTLREKGAQEASVLRAVKRHPLCNFVEMKRTEGKNKAKRIAMLYLKEPQS